MKINPTSQCLSLILRTMEDIIIPELTSKAAISAGTQIKLQLEDLLKRQGDGIVILRGLLTEGVDLCAKAAKMLDRPRLSHRATRLGVYSLRVGGFDGLAELHGELTVLVNEACRELCELTSTSPAAIELQKELAIWEFSYYSKMAALQAEPFKDSELPSPQDNLLHRDSEPPLSADFLGTFLSERQGPTKVMSLQSLPGGFGKQTYFSTVTYAGGQSEELVIRKLDPVPIVLHESFLLEREFSLLSALHKTGFPCPRPIYLGLNLPGVDGTFYTMKRVPGEIPASFLEENKQKIPESLLLQCAELLARLHRIPVEQLSEHMDRFEGPNWRSSTVGERQRRLLSSWEEYHRRVEHLPSPFHTFMFEWLRRNIPHDTRRPILVHGDFGTHNMLAVDGRVTAVLDWECADFGAPEQDLEWFRPHLSSPEDWDKFLQHYYACGGHRIREHVRAFYSVWGIMRPFLSCSRSTRNLQNGANKDIRYVMCELGFTGAFMRMILSSIEMAGQDATELKAGTQRGSVQTKL